MIQDTELLILGLKSRRDTLVNALSNINQTHTAYSILNSDFVDRIIEIKSEYDAINIRIDDLLSEEED